MAMKKNENMIDKNMPIIKKDTLVRIRRVLKNIKYNIMDEDYQIVEREFLREFDAHYKDEEN